MPKVSVIIPLYKVEKYMKKCLDSVLNQTLEDIEIILVNDGSPDNCGILAKSYSKIDKRVKYVSKENGGLSSARNAGLDIATGEYIAFIDSDDWVESDMLEIMYFKAKESDADMSICNYNRIYPNYEDNNFLDIQDDFIDMNNLGFTEYFYRYYLSYRHGDEAWNKIFRRSIIEENKIRFEKNTEIFSEDKLFNLYFILHTKKIATINQSFYYYLQRDGSLMNEPKPMLIKQYINLMDKFIYYSIHHNKEYMVKHIYPILFLNLLNSGIYYQVKSGVTSKQLKQLLIDSFTPFKNNGIMFNLFIGKETSNYCRKTNKGLIDEAQIRISGLLYFIRLYGIISIYKHKNFRNK
jgi:glycosyltransferase involved in cell wall biosynthesis